MEELKNKVPEQEQVKANFKAGDFVGHIVSLPGPDTIQAIVIQVGEKIRCYEPGYDIEFEAEPKSLWHLSEQELMTRFSPYTDHTMKDKLEIVRKDILGF